MKEEIKSRIRDGVEAIPKAYRADAVVKETIRCILFHFLKEKGLQPIPAFRNPRYQEGPAHIVGLAEDHSVVVAFCCHPSIELQDIKSLERVGCEKKYIISFSANKKKVEMSTFFLKPGIEHIYIYE